MVPDQITQDAVESAITCAAVPVVINRKMVSIPSIVLETSAYVADRNS
jgi:hypothetical protein